MKHMKAFTFSTSKSIRISGNLFLLFLVRPWWCSGYDICLMHQRTGFKPQTGMRHTFKSKKLCPLSGLNSTIYQVSPSLYFLQTSLTLYTISNSNFSCSFITWTDSYVKYSISMSASTRFTHFFSMLCVIGGRWGEFFSSYLSLLQVEGSLLFQTAGITCIDVDTSTFSRTRVLLQSRSYKS